MFINILIFLLLLYNFYIKKQISLSLQQRSVLGKQNLFYFLHKRNSSKVHILIQKIIQVYISSLFSRHEVGLMVSSIVNAARIPKAIGEVRDDLDHGGLEIFCEELEHQ